MEIQINVDDLLQPLSSEIGQKSIEIAQQKAIAKKLQIRVEELELEVNALRQENERLQSGEHGDVE